MFANYRIASIALMTKSMGSNQVALLEASWSVLQCF